ncbi:MAG: glutamate--tRNA ligase [Clostridia bacterium]|nr:glutamate--tRNA ligase [Clostridia bacterium]MDD4386927.1 glutamate--tRNA ligase [Clostridia bacterium]
MEKYIELSNLMFPELNKTVEDLETKYPKRNIEGSVTRFAPSPTGFLHTGALFTSLVNKRIADQTNGIFYLRIEDTDKKREVDGSVTLLTSEMKKFGILPNEGVMSDTEEVGEYGPYTQSKREEIYNICAKHLISKGFAYPCFCTNEMLSVTREMQEKNKQMSGYYGIYARCRNLSVEEMIEKVKSGEKYIIRLKSSGNHMKKISFIDMIRGKIDIAENDQDIVIIKSDNLPTYHFAHVVDDHFMRTTHVMRGEEWIPSVPIHLELFTKMGFKLPKFAHFPTIMVQDGVSKRKLSKRKDKEAAVSFFLNNGYPIEAVLEYLLSVINSDYEPWRMKNLDKDMFDFNIRLEKMNSAGALFDIFKLNDISKEYISKLTSKELLDKILIWSKEYNQEIFDLLNIDLVFSLKMLGIERDNVKKIRKDLVKYEDISTSFIYFFDKKFEEDIRNGYDFEYTDKITKEVVKQVLSKYLEIYNHNDDKELWFSRVKLVASSLGFCSDMKEYKLNPEKYIGNISDVAGIIRISITNRKNTPDIYAIMQVLGESKVKSRINNCINYLI